MRGICNVEGCEREQWAKGMCRRHDKRLREYGRLDLLPVPSPAERLAAKLVRQPNGCLEWTGATNDAKTGAGGYGTIYVDGKWIGTHRLAWGLAHPGEPMPPVVRHFICDNPPCCDPEHLRPGTVTENTADKVGKGRQKTNGNETKPHCPDGHEYTEANTHVSSDGRRSCRICGRAKSARYRTRVKAQTLSST